MADRSPLGVAVRRNEDSRLVTGQGRYTADVRLPGMLHVRMVRSPHAHARVRGIDAEAARRHPSVVAVWTYGDLDGVGQPMAMFIPDPSVRHPRTPHLLAVNRVRYVGEPVAIVIAESEYVAEDAAALVDVDYEVLPVAGSLADATRPGAALVHPEAAGNVAASVTIEFGDAAAAIRRAAVVVRERFELSRGSAQSLETRATVAHHDRAIDQLVVWDTTQGPVGVRNALAAWLSLPRERVRVIAGDVGGGFGPKMAFYPEEVLVPYAARRLGRPVRWVESRRESFLATTSEREQIHEVTLGADAEGRLLGLEDTFLYETGAYINYGLIVPTVTATHLGGLYKIPSVSARFDAIFTNRMFVSPYRGAGRPYATFVIERLLDRVAAELGLDPAEIRRRNLIRPDDLPYRVPVTFIDGGPFEHDSGDYPALLADALAAVDYDGVRRAQVEWRRQERYVGVGLACYVEATGIGPFEGARVRVGRDGRIAVATAVGSQGQGQETTLAQIAADRLGVRVADVAVTTGDSDAFAWGCGTYASRAAVTAGNAVALAAERVATMARAAAAPLLEAAVEDLELTDGLVHVKGSRDRGVTLAVLAMRTESSFIAPGAVPPGRPGLEAEEFFYATRAALAAGVHACVVEVDAETGVARILKYVIAHDCGRTLNPMIVEGQVVGGAAQGISGALLERLAYDEAGQLLSGTLMDYALVRAGDMPAIALSHRESASTLNPLGVKGVGESGTVAGHAVIAGALEDALRPLGVKIDRMPLGAFELRELIRQRTASR
jgi:CO/xanthine dehydrogenase Mo-binding subunit